MDSLMPSLSDCTDLTFWEEGFADLHSLAEDPGVLGGYSHMGCEHSLSGTISEDGAFYCICRKCRTVHFAEPDEDAFVVSRDGPYLTDVVAVRLLLAY
jgi:hypothetical protein